MLDPKRLRDELEQTAERLAGRGFQLDVEHISELESRRKILQTSTQELQNERNVRSKSIGKAKAAGTSDGFVKVIFDEKYGEWLGCHMIGAGVTDMIAEAVVARKLETTGHEILKAIHPHPTMSEAVMEAVADAYDEVIHL